ncbi:hypothetical protein DL768_004301 [Monosporascus sp. mg162]|nr:hypothetical protein DL768_004301 [Monosporascus sp. mg162]
MSSPACCPECSDSPLSTTGNITGILTFAYALLASCLVFLAVIRTAESEIQQLHTSVRQTSRHIETLYSYFNGLDLVADQDLAAIQDPIKVALEDWRRTNQHLTAQVEELNNIPSGIRRWLVWWYRHKDILAGVAELRSEKDDLSALLLMYMSSKISTQTDHLWRLERLVIDGMDQKAAGAETK